MHAMKATLPVTVKLGLRISPERDAVIQREALTINRESKALLQRIEGNLEELDRLSEQLSDTERTSASVRVLGDIEEGVDVQTGIVPELNFYSRVVQAMTPSQLDYLRAEVDTRQIQDAEQVLNTAVGIVKEIESYRQSLDQIQRNKAEAQAVLTEAQGKLKEMIGAVSEIITTFTDEYLDQNMNALIEQLVQEKNTDDAQLIARVRQRTPRSIRRALEGFREKYVELVRLFQSVEPDPGFLSVFDAIQSVHNVYRDEAFLGHEVLQQS